MPLGLSRANEKESGVRFGKKKGIVERDPRRNNGGGALEGARKRADLAVRKSGERGAVRKFRRSETRGIEWSRNICVIYGINGDGFEAVEACVEGVEKRAEKERALGEHDVLAVFQAVICQGVACGVVPVRSEEVTDGRNGIVELRETSAVFYSKFRREGQAIEGGGGKEEGGGKRGDWRRRAREKRWRRSEGAVEEGERVWRGGLGQGAGEGEVARGGRAWGGGGGGRRAERKGRAEEGREWGGGGWKEGGACPRVRKRNGAEEKKGEERREMRSEGEEE
ncbi:hypothetical protein Tco_0876709 [Tanacetum coccineum]|uniref:Uncharacterized protein n=1 Tax=Tanacetum coccineum TaxID=301880 RepID=A0ABQ5BWJ4_9ASTR